MSDFFVYQFSRDRVEAGEPLVEVHHRDDPWAQDVIGRLGAAIEIAEAAPVPVPLVLERIDR